MDSKPEKTQEPEDDAAYADMDAAFARLNK